MKDELDLDFGNEEYIVQTEPDSSAERSHHWKTAIGLQKTDGLVPSDYLIQTANANIRGEITLGEARKLISDYYEQKPPEISRVEEADKVSLRITELLSERSFTLSNIELMTIHERLFDGIYRIAGDGVHLFAGIIRDRDISKKEWVLNGKSVTYASAPSIKNLLKSDFDFEKGYIYAGLDERSSISRVAAFISGLWQIHPFFEGNTRAIAVFAIKYLRSSGYDAMNDTFKKYSWYYRNALVRANYEDRRQGIYKTNEYLDLFFGNLLFNENNILRNRDLHIDAPKSFPSPSSEYS